MEKYFEKFPIIQYANTSVVDITKKATLLDKVYSDPLVYYPYTISSEERADQLSYRYYQDPYRSWLIYFANKIVDPYYEWYLHEKEFNEFMNKKYGDISVAYQKVKYYKNDWSLENSISVSTYDALTVGQQKYWEPVYGYNNVISNYKRKEKDWTINTNKIVSFDVNDSNDFINDEICDIVFDSTHKGKGQISYSSNNMIRLQHISGYYDYTITGSSYIYGRESQTNTVFTSATLIINNLPEDEEAYWRSVSYYEYESDKNEFNKTVQVVDNSLSQLAADNLKDLMKE